MKLAHEKHNVRFGKKMFFTLATIILLVNCGGGSGGIGGGNESASTINKMIANGIKSGADSYIIETWSVRSYPPEATDELFGSESMEAMATSSESTITFTKNGVLDSFSVPPLYSYEETVYADPPTGEGNVDMEFISNAPVGELTVDGIFDATITYKVEDDLILAFTLSGIEYSSCASSAIGYCADHGFIPDDGFNSSRHTGYSIEGSTTKRIILQRGSGGDYVVMTRH